MVSVDDDGMRAVLDRLTRLEERGIARDERAGRMEASIAQLVTTVDGLRDDVKAAKTGLRVGLWISSTVIPAASAALGWFAHLLTGK